jgi:hypothetical protein
VGVSVYITSYKGDDVEESQPLPYKTIGEAQVALFANTGPFRIRKTWRLYEVGEGVRVALSTFRFK